MRAFEISDRKDFTAMLFLGTVFDDFQLTSARFDTFAGFTIEGHRNSGYYDSDEEGRVDFLGEQCQRDCNDSRHQR